MKFLKIIKDFLTFAGNPLVVNQKQFHTLMYEKYPGKTRYRVVKQEDCDEESTDPESSEGAAKPNCPQLKFQVEIEGEIHCILDFREEDANEDLKMHKKILLQWIEVWAYMALG
jgi:hypothetical protein